MYERSIISEIEKRLNESRRFIQVIIGPRQVGKTTLVNQLMEKMSVASHYISTDESMFANPAWLSQHWETARHKLKQSNGTESILIIDEIQKITNWSESVKKEWDADTRNGLNIKVILLGSSRLLIQKGLTESLAGRFEKIYLGHWSYEEMHDAFSLSPEGYIWFGGYPGSIPIINDEMRWKEYIRDSLIETSISKDILMLTRIEKPALMKKLFELGCLYSGQILSFTKIMGQLADAGNTTTLSHYLNLLETAGLLSGLQKFGSNIIRKRASSPKFLVQNNALITAQMVEKKNEILLLPERWGRLVESSIGAHLYNHSITGNFHLSYWREGNHEVDFVIQKGNSVVAIEVKSGKKGNMIGMEKFNSLYQPQKSILISEDSIPWQEFILINPVELFD